MNNKTLLLTLSFTLGTLLPMPNPSPDSNGEKGWELLTFRGLPKVGAKTYPKGKIFQAADYGLKMTAPG